MPALNRSQLFIANYKMRDCKTYTQVLIDSVLQEVSMVAEVVKFQEQ